MNKLFKQASVFLIIPLLLIQTSCKAIYYGRTEVSKIEFIRAVGIDKSPDNEELVRLTIATQSVHSGPIGKSQEKSSEILYSEGTTVFEAVRDFWNHMDKRPFWGHLEYLLIGEEIAREGILKYIDFFSRDPEVRLNLKIYETRDMRAEDLIKAANKEGKFIFDKLEGIAHNQWGNSVFNVVDLMETMYILDNKYLSLHIPCIRTEKFSREQEDSEGSMDILMGGYGIFEGDKLVEHIDSKMGRGLNWLMNKINSGTIVVKSPEDHNITLEIIEASTKIKPKITNGKLSVNVLIRMSSNFNEITYPENIFTEDKLLYFKNQQEELIKEEVMSVINFAQEKKMDFFGTADAVNHKYPIKWEDIYMAEWKENFSQLDFNVSVKSRINRTYDIKEPTRSKAGE